MRLLLLLAGGLLLAAAESFFLARALVRPINALQQGAERIGAGDLDQRIEIKSGDELEGLAEQFNRMGDALQASYAGLERKVEERTRELSESLEYQTATSDVLRVISSSTTDVTPVFEAIMDSAVRLFASPISAVFRYDGRLVHLVATRNWPEAAIAGRAPALPGPTQSEHAERPRHPVWPGHGPGGHPCRPGLRPGDGACRQLAPHDRCTDAERRRGRGRTRRGLAGPGKDAAAPVRICSRPLPTRP